MLFGHNTNVSVGETLFHVQTEDRGVVNALIDTTVYLRGRVLHRLTNNYLDLIPMNTQREELLRKRVDLQHRTVVEALRSGVLHLTLPKLTAEETAAEKRDVNPPILHNPPAVAALTVELMNPRSWLLGKRASLEITVRRKEDARAVFAALVKATIEGAAQPASFSAATGNDGKAQLEFDMPRLAGTEIALNIEAAKGDAKGQLRFQLRARPRVPSA